MSTSIIKVDYVFGNPFLWPNQRVRNKYRITELLISNWDYIGVRKNWKGPYS